MYKLADALTDELITGQVLVPEQRILLIRSLPLVSPYLIEQEPEETGDWIISLTHPADIALVAATLAQEWGTSATVSRSSCFHCGKDHLIGDDVRSSLLAEVDICYNCFEQEGYGEED